MTLLYIVSIPKQDDDGEYLEDHYFKKSINATMFAMANSISNFRAEKCKDSLANEIAED